MKRTFETEFASAESLVLVRERPNARRFRGEIFRFGRPFFYPLFSLPSTRLGISRVDISHSRKTNALSLFLSHLVQTGSRAAFASTAAAKPVSGFQFHVEAKQNKVARTILSQKQRTYNKARKSEIATRIKKVRTLAEVLLPSATEENVAELEKLISEATKTVDKAVAKGVLHKNTGARRKSRMARMKQGVLKANNLMTYN